MWYPTFNHSDPIRANLGVQNLFLDLFSRTRRHLLVSLVRHLAAHRNMPDFSYTARDAMGQKVSGVVVAVNEGEAAASLSARELFPLQLSTDQPRTTTRVPRVRTQMVATMYGQLAALLRSGVPLLRSIRVLRDQTSHEGLSQILDDVHDQLEDGRSLADSMGKYDRAFGELAISVIRAGEEGGFLEQALDRVALFTEQQDDLKSRVLGAMAYPIFLAVVGTIVVNVLIIFFVPKFEDLFSRLQEQGELPMVTVGLMWVSETMRAWWLFALIGLGVLFVAVRTRLATDEGRLMQDRLRLQVPVAGKIYLDLAVARFCRVLGTLIHGGVPIVRSLEISGDSTGNRVLATAVQEAAANIQAGDSLTRPLAESGHFPKHVVEMVAVAEESNTLDTVLTNIADSLERQTWRRLDLLVRMLEPVMLLILASVVLVVVVALLLPIMKMSMAM